jgi:hypothetical protein
MAKMGSLAGRPASGMDRRQAVRTLLTGTGAGLALPGLAGAHPLVQHARHAGRIEEAQARASDPDRSPEFLEGWALGMLETLGEAIVPGAHGAGCALFIDRLLAVGTREERQDFLSALGAVDAAARERFGTPWSGLRGEQQNELLVVASTAEPGRGETSWTPGTPVSEHLARMGSADAPLTLRDQFDLLKGWVIGAYYTSEVGLRELGYQGPVFADSFPGCPHPEGHE